MKMELMPLFFLSSEEETNAIIMGLSDDEYEFSLLMDQVFVDCFTFAEVYAVFYYEYPQYLYGSGTSTLKRNWTLYQKSLQPEVKSFRNPWV